MRKKPDNHKKTLLKHYIYKLFFFQSLFVILTAQKLDYYSANKKTALRLFFSPNKAINTDGKLNLVVSYILPFPLRKSFGKRTKRRNSVIIITFSQSMQCSEKHLYFIITIHCCQTCF